MSRYVAWLRGINVGPAQRIAMADLRALVEALGYRHVRTLRNSGNVIFDGPARATTYHAGQIHEALPPRWACKCQSSSNRPERWRRWSPATRCRTWRPTPPG
jgi:uncharacterized protein (DUF1697 family)